MKLRTTSEYLLLTALAVLVACTGDESSGSPVRLLHTTRLEALPFVSSQPSFSLRWPAFLLADAADRYLWGEGRQVLEIEAPRTGPVIAKPEESNFTRGLDKLIAAARTSEGTLVVLDVSGRVAVHSPDGQMWKFETQLANEPGNLAITKDRIYLLLQGQSRTGSAVAAYTFSGSEIGQWGEMPADGIIQANLRGGGIAACPDGSIFYSYINSPQILKLQNDEKKSVRFLGKADSSFDVISKSRIFRAAEEGMRSGSPGPLVKLGLGGSRVMALACSKEGLLFRQVAVPAGKGSYVEVWDPVSSALVGTIPKVDGVLMDVSGHTLYLGTSEGNKFVLYRVGFRLEPFRSGKEAV